MRFWTRLGLLLMVGVLTVLGVQRLRLETDILATLPPDLPEARGLRLLRDGFSGGDELLVGLTAPTAAEAEAAVQTLGNRLAGQPRLVREVQWAGRLENPDTAAALLAWAWLNAPAEKVQALKDRLDPARLGAHLEGVMDKLASSPDPAVVQQWSYDPLGLLEVVDPEAVAALDEGGFSMASADGTTRLLLVAPAEKLTGYKRAAAWLAEVHDAVAAWRTGAADRAMVKVYYSGEPAFMAETGSGIEKDLSGTLGVATVLIAGLFWFMFRRWRMLLWIQVLLGLVVAVTLALGGWVVGELSIMSLGFASILLGIAVDYAVFILQEGMDRPHLSAAQLRRSALPPIFGGACTTATVFLALLFSGLPGLADMGVMVALGVMAGFLVMVLIMPEMVVRARVRPTVLPETLRPVSSRGGLVATGVAVLLLAGVFAVRGFPRFESSSAVLRPTQSQAMAALDRLQASLGRQGQATVPVIVEAETWQAAGSRVQEMTRVLEEARRGGAVVRAVLPAALLPQPGNQPGNALDLAGLAAEAPRLRAAVQEAGFTEEALSLTERLWQRFTTQAAEVAQAGPMPLPGERVARVLVGRFFNPDAAGGKAVVLGSAVLHGEPGKPDLRQLADLQSRLGATPVHLAGWETLGPALSAHINRDLSRLMPPLLVVLAVMLGVTFRRWQDFLLCLLMLFLGIACLAATMAVLGQSWNLANVAALPLLLGLGIDYGIHMLLAMNREQNHISKVWATTGRAVFFCGVTTVIGFVSLVFASNGGVASLGLAGAVGSLWTLVVALWLLPSWKAWLGARHGTKA